MNQVVKNNKRNFNPIAVLMILCCFLAVVLALVDSATRPAIDARKRQEELEAYQEISQGYDIVGALSTDGVAEPVLSYYNIRRGDAKGYIVNLTGSGYGGAFKMAACYDSSGKLLAARMLENSETPGLGKNSEESWYMPLFAKGSSIPASKNDLPEEDRALVTGASVTFAGVSHALSAGSEWVRRRGI